MPRGRKAWSETSPPMEIIARQIKMTNVLLAAGLLQHLKQIDIVELLKSTGATTQEIAEVLGTSSATIAVTVGRLKKRHKGEPHGEEGTTETDLRES